MNLVKELVNTTVRSQNHLMNTISEHLREMREENEAEGLKNSLKHRVVAIAHLRFSRSLECHQNSFSI